ncbi:MAG: prepilin peptidase, partial [Terriglobales bacterium]
ALQGRCRGCRARIPWRYPLLELGTAAAFVWAWRRTGGGGEFVREAFFLACLLALAATDLDCRQLPDELTLGGWCVGLAFAMWAPAAGGLARPGLLQATVASLGGAGVLALVALAYQRWRGRMGLGWGDVKMIGMLGAFLGLGGSYLALLAASVAAAVAGLALAGGVLLRRRWQGRTWRRALQAASVYIARGPIPLGAFLAAAGAAALAWAPALWGAWLR